MSISLSPATTKGDKQIENPLFNNLQVKCHFPPILIAPLRPPPHAAAAAAASFLYQPLFSSTSQRAGIGLFASSFELVFHEDRTALQNLKTRLPEGQAHLAGWYRGVFALFCFALGFGLLI